RGRDVVRGGRVAVGCPLEQVVELTQNLEGVALGDRLLSVHGSVPGLSDHVGFTHALRAHGGDEARLAETCVEVGLIGQGETFEVEYDDDDELDHTTGVERARSWVSPTVRLRTDRVLADLAPFGGDEVEVGGHARQPRRISMRHIVTGRCDTRATVHS